MTPVYLWTRGSKTRATSSSAAFGTPGVGLRNRAEQRFGAGTTPRQVARGRRGRPTRDVHATEEGSEDEARRRLEDLLHAVGCEAEIQIATGSVKDAILRATSRSAADALIIGRQPPGGSSGRLRDLTYSLVRDSPCPVLSV